MDRLNSLSVITRLQSIPGSILCRIFPEVVSSYMLSQWTCASLDRNYEHIDHLCVSWCVFCGLF